MYLFALKLCFWTQGPFYFKLMVLLSYILNDNLCKIHSKIRVTQIFFRLLKNKAWTYHIQIKFKSKNYIVTSIFTYFSRRKFAIISKDYGDHLHITIISIPYMSIHIYKIKYLFILKRALFNST